MALEPVGGKYEGVWINKLRNGDISYYINYRNEHGKPVKLQVGKKTKISDFSIKEAYDKLIEIKYKLQFNEEPAIKGSRASKVRFDDLWQEFSKYAKANKKSYIIDEQNYNKHIKPIFGQKNIKDITSLNFEKFKQSLVEKGLEPQTVKHQLTLARTIINYAIKHDIVKSFTNPISNGRVKMPDVDNKRQSFLTKNKPNKYLRYCETSVS